MSVATEITRLQNAKADLKASINAKTDSQHQIDNETIDEYADFVDSIQTGGDLPTKGFIVNEWDANGYPTKVTTVGLTKIPTEYFRNFSGSYLNIGSTIREVVFPSEVTEIDGNCFYSNTIITNVSMPSVTSIKANCFYYCSNLLLSELPAQLAVLEVGTFDSCKKITVDKIPNAITTIYGATFRSCTGIKKMNLNNVETVEANAFRGSGLYSFYAPSIINLYGSSGSQKSFGDCLNLKAVWIGSSITTMHRYVFGGDTNLKKIYIDLPRTTVENMANYNYAWMNDTTKTGIIVCNDDTGFLTAEQFNAIDWETYTP